MNTRAWPVTHVVHQSDQLHDDSILPKIITAFEQDGNSIAIGVCRQGIAISGGGRYLKEYEKKAYEDRCTTRKKIFPI